MDNETQATWDMGRMYSQLQVKYDVLKAENDKFRALLRDLRGWSGPKHAKFVTDTINKALGEKDD